MQVSRIGFIGQGFVGKTMADDFEARGHQTVRYALEEPYIHNKDRLATCQVVFIAVPTPTRPEGFDASAVRSALALLAPGTAAVIKSTILPGTTEQLQANFPGLTIMHAPEFLREKSAAEDTAHPERNIIGIAHDDAATRTQAQTVLELLPPAPYSLITTARNAECIKYIGNTYLYTKLLFFNLAYNFVQGAGADWQQVREAAIHDSRVGASHTQPIGADGGRGAGGHCFIKDFEAFLQFYAAQAQDSTGLQTLEAMRAKNNQLLTSSGKDLDLLGGVYGPESMPV